MTGLVLRGIFLGRPQEIDWFLRGMGTIFPEAWNKFVNHLPEAERGDILDAYLARLNHPAPDIHLAAARVWATYESACSTLLPGPTAAAPSGEDRMALCLARIEAHYMKHQLFMAPNALLRNISRIRKIPGIIVQGRYDIVCPVTTAHDLARGMAGGNAQNYSRRWSLGPRAGDPRCPRPGAGADENPGGVAKRHGVSLTTGDLFQATLELVFILACQVE